MEGRWRGVVGIWAALGCATVALAGCGNSDTDSAARSKPTEASPGVRTAEPERTFAPVVRLHPDESRMPVSANWFLQRSTLLFTEDHGCPDRKIAVGRTLDEQRTAVTNWLSTRWLGKGPHYWRNANNVHCELDFSHKFFADQHTRPYTTRNRPADLGVREGFVLDLDDRALGTVQAKPQQADGERTIEVSAYVDKRPATVGGAPGLRLTYWLLYAINEPRNADGRVDPRLVHEGDWERADVLLKRRERGDRYIPVSVTVYADGEASETPWRELPRIDDPSTGKPTHPLLLAARGSHALAPGSGVDCRTCPTWRTWTRLADVEKEPWFGFGGAWGGIGDDSLTTGPAGPHDGSWPSAAEIAKRE